MTKHPHSPGKSFTDPLGHRTLDGLGVIEGTSHKLGVLLWEMVAEGDKLGVLDNEG